MKEKTELFIKCVGRVAAKPCVKYGALFFSPRILKIMSMVQKYNLMNNKSIIDLGGLGHEYDQESFFRYHKKSSLHLSLTLDYSEKKKQWLLFSSVTCNTHISGGFVLL